jgi:hypothetical protein
MAAKIQRLQEKVVLLKEHLEKLKTIETQLQEAPDKQISLIDPDARSMATSGRGTGMVGYNVQTAVDIQSHISLWQASGLTQASYCQEHGRKSFSNASVLTCPVPPYRTVC